MNILITVSHPMWVRGLKHVGNSSICLLLKSHPMWVRGLKQEARICS